MSDTGDIDGCEAPHTLPSKSQRKRDMKALQKLSASLAELSPSEREGLNLQESFDDTIAMIACMKPSGARNRQLRQAAKLLSRDDVLVDQIRAFLDARLKQARRDRQRHRHIEHWRDRLMEGGNEQLAEILDSYPETDRQELGTLVRNARREKARDMAPAQQRKLFRYLRDRVIRK